MKITDELYKKLRKIDDVLFGKSKKINYKVISKKLDSLQKEVRKTKNEIYLIEKVINERKLYIKKNKQKVKK